MNNSAFGSNDRIVNSILDTDFYKLTMMQAVLHHYPNAMVEWAFKCRNSEDLIPYIPEIKRQVERLEELSLTEDEADYLTSIHYFKPDFIRFLDLFKFKSSYVNIENDNGELTIRIAGPWLQVILFEIPLLAIVSETRNKILYPEATLDSALGKLDIKLKELNQENPDIVSKMKMADFGTRRRFSYKVQDHIVDKMQESFPGLFVGTSNVDMARRKNIRPMGTMAHEWLMAHQQLGSRLIDSQKTALEVWVQEYRGELGVALTDCITTDSFLEDFDLYFAKLFDGLRHDSGDPIEFAEKCIAHYQKLGIDPMSKTLIFSDGLNFNKCIDIMNALEGRIGYSFGVGTNLTCDIPGIEPLNIVIKMISCNGQPVAKISDSPGKTMCEDPQFVDYLKHTFKV